MKTKVLFILLLFFIIGSFSIISLTKNIYIKFNEFEFISYLFDSKRSENFNILVEKDIKNKLNERVKISLGNNLVFSESLKNLGVEIIPLDKNKFTLTLSNTYVFLKEFYFSESGYLISLDYQIKFNKDILKNVIEKKISSIKKDDFKKYFIKNYSIDITHGLVGIEDNFPNISIGTEKNKYSLVVDIDSFNNVLTVKNSDFSKLEILIPTKSNGDLFEEQYQTKIQNYNTKITIKNEDLNYNHLFSINSILEKEITKEDLFLYLDIKNQIDLYFSFKDKFLENLTTLVTKKIIEDKYLLDYYVTPLRTSDEINGKYKVIIKKINFFSLQTVLKELKTKLVNDGIFQSLEIPLEVETEIKDKFFSYKTDYNINLKDKGYNTMTCDIFDGIMDYNNIRKRLVYNIQKRHNFTSSEELEKYIFENKDSLNYTLNIITQALLEHNLLITNSLSNEIISFPIERGSNLGPFPFLYFDYLSESNNLIISADTDFIGLCNYNQETETFNISILSNKKKGNSIMFGHEKRKKYDKWTIEINGVISTPIIYK